MDVACKEQVRVDFLVEMLNIARRGNSFGLEVSARTLTRLVNNLRIPQLSFHTIHTITLPTYRAYTALWTFRVRPVGSQLNNPSNMTG